jgi:hypothetical protein
MATGVIQEFPATREQYDAVQSKMDATNNPPQGLILHTAAEIADGMRVVDFWESAADWESFREQRLGPAIAEVAGGNAPTPKIEVFEVFDVVKP